MADYQLNVLGLGETILEMKDEKLKNVTQLVIQKIDKNNKPIDEVIIDRDSLPNKLCEVFDSGVSGLKEIKILYIKYGLRNDLTEIEIFN